MPELDRKTLICQQLVPVLTGIDFVQVVDHTTQDVLHVYFLIDPALVDAGAAFPSAVAVAAMSDLERSVLSIDAPETGVRITIDSAVWINVIRNGVTRKVLEISVDEPGGTELFVLRYPHPAMDRFFDHVSFSFKQGCPVNTDCKVDDLCPESVLADVDIDYLARDFGSLRSALIDFAAAHYPQWEARIVADPGMMMLEIMAALGDDFAYQQDRLASEAYLETATQTQSVVNLARLVDYEMDQGAAATTLLTFGVNTAVMTVSNETMLEPSPDRVFAIREDLGAVPFELSSSIWLHPAWNSASLYLPDSAQPCLPIGATEAYVDLPPPSAAQLPPAALFVPPSDIWLGRQVVLRSGQSDPSNPKRAWAITIQSVTPYNDPLNPGVGTLSCITWTEPLPFEMPIEIAQAYFNVVPAIAGQTITDLFRVGDDDAMAQANPAADAVQLEKLQALPRVTEREGACSGSVRGIVYRYGLNNSEVNGVSWANKRPALALREMLPDLGVAGKVDFTGDQIWDYVPSILDADAEDRAFTLEHGLWAEAVRFSKPSGDVVLHDYISNNGFSLRFGDREFGIAPADGAVLELRYLSAPGPDANLPTDSISFLVPPEGSAAVATIAYADWVTNPFIVHDARPAETLDSIRMNAPEAFRAILLRAVRKADYQSILERRETIQQANAVTRWTGSWSTDFVAVDPIGTQVFESELRREIELELECIRQAGRQVCLRDADYVPVDVKIDVCVEPDAANAAMVKAITSALKNFFDPDKFSFGTALIRSDLEAEVQCVAGVRGVETIELRRRGKADFEPMPARLNTAPHQILQVANDPARPERGFIEVSAHGGG